MVTMKPTERDKCKNRFQQIMRDGNSRTDNQSKQAAAWTNIDNKHFKNRETTKLHNWLNKSDERSWPGQGTFLDYEITEGHHILPKGSFTNEE